MKSPKDKIFSADGGRATRSDLPPPLPDSLPQSPGYHLTEIPKGVFGDPSKIFEEVEEFRDALDQGIKVMALVELSDLIGAIDGYLSKHHPGTNLGDLIQMSNVTQRAFRNGRR